MGCPQSTVSERAQVSSSRQNEDTSTFFIRIICVSFQRASCFATFDSNLASSISLSTMVLWLKLVSGDFPDTTSDDEWKKPGQVDICILPPSVIYYQMIRIFSDHTVVSGVVDHIYFEIDSCLFQLGLN